jgi:hypothetical protein
VSQGIGVAIGGAVAEGIGSASTTIALAGAVGVVIAVPATIAWARQNRAGDAAYPAKAGDGKAKNRTGGQPEASRA